MLRRTFLGAAAAAPLLPLTQGATQIVDEHAEERLGRDAFKWLAAYGVQAVVLHDDTFGDDHAAWTDRPHGIRLIKASALAAAEAGRPRRGS